MGRFLRCRPPPIPGTSGLFTSLIGSSEIFSTGNPVFPAPFDVRLPRGEEKEVYTVVQPDLCVICDPKKLDEKGCLGAPDLVVEVLSPGNSQREMREKFEVYEEAGVREYWIVIPWDKLVLVYLSNEQGRFIGLQPLTNDQVLISSIFPDLQIGLEELFRE